MNTSIRRTNHAENRQALRNLSDEDVLFVFEHGQRIRCAGVVHVFLGKRDIPRDKATYQRFARLEGTVLVLDDTYGEVVLITAYRNRQALKHIRPKTKYDRTSARTRQHSWAIAA